MGKGVYHEHPPILHVLGENSKIWFESAIGDSNQIQEEQLFYLEWRCEH